MANSNQQVHLDPRTYAWNYFSTHAAQRMSVFQFFISLSTAIVGGAVLIAGSATDRSWSALLFLLLPFLAFVFWRLDSRTSELIKNAEVALKSLEGSVENSTEGKIIDPLALFTNDENVTDRKGTGFFTGHMSYSKSFRFVFIATAVLGLVGATVALVPRNKKEPTKEPASNVDTQTVHIPEQRLTQLSGTASSRIELPEGVEFRLDVTRPSSIDSAGDGKAKDSANEKAKENANGK